jgi:hypothetical protein
LGSQPDERVLEGEEVAEAGISTVRDRRSGARDSRRLRGSLDVREHRRGGLLCLFRRAGSLFEFDKRARPIKNSGWPSTIRAA